MEHEKIFIALMAAHSAHAEASRKVIAELGLTEGQPRILYILYRQDGHVQKELAQIAGIRESTLTVLLSKLEKIGYIRKEICYVSGKKRAYKIFLTEEGRAKAEELENVVEALEVKSFQGFSKEERETVLKLITRIEENLKQ